MTFQLLNTKLKIVDVNLIPERDNDSEDLIFNINNKSSVSDAQIKYSNQLMINIDFEP